MTPESLWDWINTDFGAGVVRDESALDLNMMILSSLSLFKFRSLVMFSLDGSKSSLFRRTWETLHKMLGVFTIFYRLHLAINNCAM